MARCLFPVSHIQYFQRILLYRINVSHVAATEESETGMCGWEIWRMAIYCIVTLAHLTLFYLPA